MLCYSGRLVAVASVNQSYFFYIVSDLPSPSHSIFSPQNATNRHELEQFLRFSLESHTTAMLPVCQIAEVVKISSHQIVPLPHLPAWVMGVYNWRGKILWMVNLGRLISLKHREQQGLAAENYTAIVLTGDRTSATTVYLGLVVTQVEDIEWCNPSQIQALPAATTDFTLASLFRGRWLKSDRQTLLVLDGKAILAAMPQKSSV